MRGHPLSEQEVLLAVYLSPGAAACLENLTPSASPCVWAEGPGHPHGSQVRPHLPAPQALATPGSSPFRQARCRRQCPGSA